MSRSNINNDAPHNATKNRTSPSAGSVLLRCAVMLAVVIGAILGYWSSVVDEQVELPGIKSQIRVMSFTHLPPEDVVDDLKKLAENNSGDIIVEAPTPTGRMAYAAGAKSTQWIEEGYQGIPGSPGVEFRPLTELPYSDYRQVLELMGSSSLKDEVIRYLVSHDIEHEELIGQKWVFLLSGTALGDITKLLIGFCIAFAAIGMIVNSHAEAVRRLHGYRLWRSVLYEFKRSIHTAQIIPLLALVTIALGISFFASVNSALQMLKYQATFIAAGLLAACIAVVLTLALVRLIAIPPLLSGKLPGKSVLGLIYLIRLGACVVIASLLIGASNYSLEWGKQKQEEDLWSAMPASYSMSLSGARELEELNESGQQLAAALRAISAKDSLAYAQYIDPGLVWGSNLDRDVMVYNQAAAKTSLTGQLRKEYETALLHDGGLSEPLELIPDGLSQGVNLDLVEKGAIGGTVAKEMTYREGDSAALTWEVGNDEWMNRAQVPNPIVIVFPDDNIPLSDRNITAAVTQKDISLLNYEDYLKLQENRDIGSFIRSAERMSETWSHNHRTMGQTVWIYSGGLIASILLSLIVSVAAVNTVLRVFHQRLRAGYIHGVAPLKLILGAILAELGIVIATCYYLWQRGATVRAWSEGSLAGAADPSTMAMLHVPNVAWWGMPIFILLTSVPLAAIFLIPRMKNNLIHTRK